jgi:hypothetical protein
VQVVKPRTAKLLVRKLLSDEAGRLEFEQNGMKRRLQGTLLVAAAKYEVDDWLKDYIWDSVTYYNDFEYALLCTRILSWRLDNSCFRFHQILIPRLSQPWHIDQYLKQLAAILRRFRGARLFLLWYHSFSDTAAALPSVPMELWTAAVESILEEFSADPCSQLLRAEFEARRGTLTAHRFLEIVGLYDEAGPEMVIETLCRLHAMIRWELVVPADPAAFALKEPYTLNALGFSFALDPRSPVAKVLDQAYVRVLELSLGLDQDSEVDLELD